MAPNYVYSVPVKPLPRALAGMTGGRHHGDEGTGDNGRATGMLFLLLLYAAPM